MHFLNPQWLITPDSRCFLHSQWLRNNIYTHFSHSQWLRNSNNTLFPPFSVADSRSHKQLLLFSPSQWLINININYTQLHSFPLFSVAKKHQLQAITRYFLHSQWLKTSNYTHLLRRDWPRGLLEDIHLEPHVQFHPLAIKPLFKLCVRGWVICII